MEEEQEFKLKGGEVLISSYVQFSNGEVHEYCRAISADSVANYLEFPSIRKFYTEDEEYYRLKAIKDWRKRNLRPKDLSPKELNDLPEAWDLGEHNFVVQQEDIDRKQLIREIDGEEIRLNLASGARIGDTIHVPKPIRVRAACYKKDDLMFFTGEDGEIYAPVEAEDEDGNLTWAKRRGF